MFNIRFICLKRFDITWDFWFTRMIQNILKSQYKCKLHLAKYSNCSAQFNRNTKVIPITGLYNMLTVTMLGVPSHQEGRRGLEQLEPIALFEILVLNCSVLYSAWDWATHTLPPCWSGQLGETFTILMDAGRNIYTTSWSTQLLIAVCWDKVSFLCHSCGHSHPTLFLDLQGHNALVHLLEPSSNLRVYRSATK